VRSQVTVSSQVPDCIEIAGTKKKGIEINGTAEALPDPTAARIGVPLGTRLSHEIPKPKDWQAFQRNCVLLFRAELKDPNTQEYGRSGQNQSGIDLLGRRNGDPDHYVGVQCRLIAKPLKEEKILTDCRAALNLKAGLKEIIFATTAPDDTGASDAAIVVEQALRGEGHNLTVVIYGWAALQTLIAVHEIAYAAFFPSSVATAAPQVATTTSSSGNDFAYQIATLVAEQLRQTGLPLPSRDIGAANTPDEDPALHARIDIFRDIFRDQHQPLLAQDGLLAILKKEVLGNKPWARFRIETNLGAIALELGQQEEGAAHYETAYSIRPDDANAIANLALARTIQGHHETAMELARCALRGEPRADHAVAYLLQAAARSSWQGDPETLIPPDLVGNEHADLGLVEFLRRRNLSDWAERTLKVSLRHPNCEVFNRIKAIAVLSLMLDSGGIISNCRASVTTEELNAAANHLTAMVEHWLNIGFADQYDLAANLSNAGLLLRLTGRPAECEALLQRGLPKVPDDPQLRRLLALAQASLGRQMDALRTLSDDQDPENCLLRAELSAINEPSASLAQVLAMDPATLSPRLTRLRWDVVGELALKTGELETLKTAVAALKELHPTDVTASLLELRGEQRAGLVANVVKERLRAISISLPADVDMATRFFVAEELRKQGLPEQASLLLEHHVDLSRKNPATTLYLQSLAEARRDEAFHMAVATVAPIVRDDSEILWTIAAHSWNEGDLAAAYRIIEELLSHEPHNARARLLKIEILVRQDRSTEVFAELDKRVEDLTWTRLQDRFRIVLLLGYFGYIERAAAFAYRLFLEHRDKSQAWMTLCMLLLREGRGGEDGASQWTAPVVTDHVAVDLLYDNGEELFLIVEPDSSLRSLDNKSWEPDHPLVHTLMGLTAESRLIDANGRGGTIVQLRHKYVARLHYILQRYESRFPEIFGLRMVALDADRPDGLDDLIAELKARQEWFKAEQEQYRNGPWPLGVLAKRLGLDSIEIAMSLAAQGIALKVAIGNEPEREVAVQAIDDNAGKGCVLDLLALWTGWRLQALDAIATVCGPIYLPQSVIDHLRARRELMDFSRIDGMHSVSYEAGKLSLHEVAPEEVSNLRDDLDRAIIWAETNASICPLIVREDLPPILRDFIRAGRSDVFDCLAVAKQAGVMLVTDDLPTREFSRLLAGVEGAWLHKVFEVALHQKSIDLDTFVRWTAHLINAGHDYISVTAQGLVRALHLDAETGRPPDYFFKTLCKVIGGRNAQPISHIKVCAACLVEIWSSPNTPDYRSQASGLLIQQLVRERNDDFVSILRGLLLLVGDSPPLVGYILSWARGHFILERVLPGVGMANGPAH
jgi:Flp pilus assembly protein TadD